MKILWYELKKAVSPVGETSPVVFWRKNYGIQVNANGLNIDGKSVSKNHNTFWLMYQSNTDVMRCIEEKVQTAMKKGFELQKKQANGKMKLVEDDDFMTALGDTDELKKLFIMSLDIFGDLFIRRRRNIRKQVIWYEVLDTREVSVVTDAYLKPIRYIYRRVSPGSTTVENYNAEDIEHFKSGHNFSNPLFWTSVLSTLIYDVLGDEEANKTNYYYYLNDAVPSAVYILRENLSLADQNKTIENIQDTLKGSHNAGKSMISGAVKDVKTIQTPGGNLDDIEKRRYATEKVCAGLGVPRSILGYIYDVNYSNGDVQLKKFIENTIQPLERILEKIFTKLSQDFMWYSFVINSEHIDQLDQLSRIARDNVNSGLWTRNEAREYLGWDAIADDLANELTISSNMQLLDNLLLWEPDTPALDENWNPVITI